MFSKRNFCIIIGISISKKGQCLPKLRQEMDDNKEDLQYKTKIDIK